MNQIDDTQPTNAVIDTHPYVDDSAMSGPGCFIWGVVGSFTVGLSVIVVILAAFVGWSDGMRTGQLNATAAAQSEIDTQCNLIPDDLTAGRLGLANQRFTVLSQLDPTPDCIGLYAPTATAAFIEAQPTATATPSPTVEITAEPTQEDVTAAPDDETSTAPTPEDDSAFDPEYWLAEAQRLISEDELEEAIAALEAVQAIDPDYEKATVDRLLFNSLTTLARQIFVSGQNLAYAITLSERARQFGDIGELNYESYIANLYLEAQSASGVNYLRAINALRTIIFEQGLTNYRDAYQMLVNEYTAYGDAYVAGGEPCPAVQQYDNALSMQASASITAKRDAAQNDCDALLSGTPQDPNATQSGVAPVGVPGN